jgi:hypothetical protein
MPGEWEGNTLPWPPPKRARAEDLEPGVVPFRYGYCPGCHQEPVFVNVHKAHYAVCPDCRLAWSAGWSLSRNWQHETEEAWRKNRDQLEIYTPVEPYRPDYFCCAACYLRQQAERLDDIIAHAEDLDEDELLGLGLEIAEAMNSFAVVKSLHSRKDEDEAEPA